MRRLGRSPRASSKSFRFAIGLGFLLAGDALASSPALEEEWKQVKAADSPITYARFLEAHPDFDRMSELMKRLHAANRRAAEKGRQIDLPVTRFERVEESSQGAEKLAFLGETADRAGRRHLRLELTFAGGRLVPGVAKEKGRGSWAYFFAEASALVDSMPTASASQPVLAVVWGGPDKSLPPAEVYLGGSRATRLIAVSTPAPRVDPSGQRDHPDSLSVYQEPAVSIRIFPPDYPDEAKQGNIGGLVLVRVTVSRTGRVTHAEVLSSDTVPVLETAAVRAALLSLFRPATRNGIPVESRVVVPFRFKH
jgi:TonB family protein